MRSRNDKPRGGGVKVEFRDNPLAEVPEMGVRRAMIGLTGLQTGNVEKALQVPLSGRS